MTTGLTNSLGISEVSLNSLSTLPTTTTTTQRFYILTTGARAEDLPKSDTLPSPFSLLTDKGASDALQIGQKLLPKLPGPDLVHIHYSMLGAASQTVQNLQLNTKKCTHIQIEKEGSAAFNDINLGKWEGQSASKGSIVHEGKTITIEDAKKEWNSFSALEKWDQPHLPGGESDAKAAGRFLEGMEAALKGDPNATHLIVTHLKITHAVLRILNSDPFKYSPKSGTTPPSQAVGHSTLILIEKDPKGPIGTAKAVAIFKG